MLFLILTGGFQYLVAILFFYVLIKKIFQLCLTTDWDSLCVYSQLRYCKVKKTYQGDVTLYFISLEHILYYSLKWLSDSSCSCVS